MPRSLRSPKLVKRRRRELAFKLALCFFVIALVIALPVWLSRASFLSIDSISVNGNVVLSNNEIIDEVNKTLDGEWFLVFKKNSSILYPRKTIEKNILTRFSRVASVTVGLDSLKKIQIKVEERAPAFLWCRLSPKECFFVDNSGLVFAPSPDFSKDVYVTFDGRISGNPIGQRYLDIQGFSALKDLITGLSSFKLVPQRVSHLEGNSYSISFSQGGMIIVSLSDDSKKILSNFESVLTDPTLNLFDGEALRVYSIDLRYGNKVILKKQKE